MCIQRQLYNQEQSVASLHAYKITYLFKNSIDLGHREPKSRPTWIMDGFCQEAGWQLPSKVPEKEATTGIESEIIPCHSSKI